MEFERALTYAADDKEWFKKLGIGALISLVPILNFAWIGYIIEIVRNVSEGHDLPLPGWENLGEKFKSGLIIFLVFFLYTLPALLVFILPGMYFYLQASSNGSEAINWMTIAGTSFYCLFAVYFLAISFLFPAMMIRYSRLGTFRSCFQVKEIINLALRNIGEYVIAWGAGWLFALLINFVAVIIGALLIITCIGPIVVPIAASVYTSLVVTHLFGQVGARQSAIV